MTEKLQTFFLLNVFLRVVRLHIRYNALDRPFWLWEMRDRRKGFVIKIPLNEMGWKEEGEYKITNLWTNEIKIVRAKNMKCLKVTVPGDYNAGGGYGHTVLKKFAR
ncbi:MAG: hypothetical protein ACLSD7_01210 [Coprococcus phoceensis]